MNIALAQDGRQGRLKTALSDDDLVLSRFDGQEHVNRLFEYRVEALAGEAVENLEILLGTHATVALDTPQGGEHFFDGIVTKVRWTGAIQEMQRYEMTLRPWLWLAGKRRNQRIFHEMSVVEILTQLFESYSGVSNPHLENNLTGTYPTLEYTVQYRESDLDFAKRLMERFAINYYFIHDEGAHTLVLTDSVEEHLEIPGTSRPYHPVTGARVSGEETFWSWTPERKLTTGKIRLTDFNFKTPTASMEVDRSAEAEYENGQIESYDYPGDYLEANDGKGVVARRLDQEQAQDVRHYAVGDVMSLSAGMTVKISGDELDGVTGEEFVCLSSNHSFHADSFMTSGVADAADDDGPSYHGSYVLAPKNAPLAPARISPPPVVHGPQTGMVVGDGEIDCDEFGRIEVQLHWDLNGSKTMRCRVSQNWAGKGWGGMVIPRIGMEVVVEFLEGDPDKPLVTGCVYNGKNTVPYDLPANKTRSTFKTDSHGGSGYNELRFEDQSGSEEIWMHAQKDRNEVTGNNHTEQIGNDWHQNVGHDKQIEIKNDHDELIGGSMTVVIGPTGIGQMVGQGLAGIKKSLDAGVQQLGIPSLGGGDYLLIAEKSTTELVGLEKEVKVGLKSETWVGLESKYTVGQKIEVESGSTIGTKAGKAISTEAGEAISVKAGESIVEESGKDFGITAGETIVVNAGKTMVIEVGDELKLKCGSAEIGMKKNGDIQIKGKNLDLKGSGKIGAKASSSVMIKGSKVDIN